MLFVISYDIEDDRSRSHIASILSGYGQRVQKSVFECELDKKLYDELIKRLQKRLKNGNIRIYQICAVCRRQAKGLGDVLIVDPPAGFWVG